MLHFDAFDAVKGIDTVVYCQMRPSFYTLFKRGRYFRFPQSIEDDDEEMIRIRKEAERFAAAAIGFCMHHNLQFRRFFLKKICRIAIQSGAKSEVEVEPESWADLLIRFGRKSVCVVEFKLGAPLQEHQNPTRSEFWETSEGYGLKLEDSYPSHMKTFVVLGHRDYLTLSRRSNWVFVQADWGDLADGFEENFGRSLLLCDLRDCLAQFGIWEFSSMKTRELCAADSRTIMASIAWKILWDAFTAPSLQFSKGSHSFRVDAECSNFGKWYFGIEIRSTASKSLARLRPNKKGEVIWFGYECERRGEVWQSVWYYCENETIAQLVANRLKRSKNSSRRLLQRADEQGNNIHIGIRERCGYGRKELDWFIQALAHANYLASNLLPDPPARSPKRTSRRRRL